MKGLLKKTTTLALSALLLTNTMTAFVFADEEPEGISQTDTNEVLEIKMEETAEIQEVKQEPAPVEENNDVSDTEQPSEEIVEVEESKQEMEPEIETTVYEIVFAAEDDGFVSQEEGKEEAKQLKQSVSQKEQILPIWAVPATGYEFLCWELDGSYFSNKAKIEANEIELANHRFVARFQKIISEGSESEEGEDAPILTLSLKATDTTTSVSSSNAAEADNLTVHIINILWTVKGNINGQVVPSTYEMTMVKGQGKLATGFNSFVGGKNITSSGFGYSYKFLNGFVLTDANGSVITAESLDEVDSIYKVNYNGDGKIVVTMADKTTKELSGHDLYISPVYSAKANWYLNFYYIDNLSTASGSWSNKGGVSSFSHTFKAPDAVAHYQFLYWLNTDNNARYNAGETATYDSSMMKNGETKNVYVYAYYQPSVTVNYHDYNSTSSVESFSQIKVYDFTPEVQEDVEFVGWFDEQGNRIDENEVYFAPAISAERNAAITKDVYARYTTSITVIKLWEDENNRYSVRPENIEVQLYNGETKVASAELNEENNWTYTFENLEAYENGQLISYSVSEDEVPLGYEKSIENNTITNRHLPLTYTVEHYQQNTDDDGYTLVEEDVLTETGIKGYEVEAQINTYEGFSFNEELSNTKEVLNEETTLKLYYDRNTHTVSYIYTGKVPGNASALPETRTYRYGQEVEVASEASAKNYKFSGWNITGTFTMPDQDVEISGSFKANPLPSVPEEPETEPVIVPVIIPTPEDDPVIEEEIIDAPVPMSEPEVLDIADEIIPMAQPEEYWALINLIAVILTVIISIGMLVSFLRKRNEEEEEAEEVQTIDLEAKEDKEDEKEENGRKKSKLLGLLPAILAIVIFILTEDMRNPMILTDRYTFLMIIIAVADLLLAYLSRNKKKEKQEEEEIEPAIA